MVGLILIIKLIQYTMKKNLTLMILLVFLFSFLESFAKESRNVKDSKIKAVVSSAPIVELNGQLQKRTVIGRVIDSSGGPLPGVSVIVKGTTVGIITDSDGNYALEIPDDAEIISFSFVGMKTQEIVIGAQTQINVTLEEEAVGLDEVVAIGYGVQKKSNITGAISSVKSSDLENRSSTNVASALQGKTAGVQVLSTSGAPGSNSTVRIRGISSNASSAPLYIVDGLKVTNIGSSEQTYGTAQSTAIDMNFLDPENIESIEILKDAASAAIYGAEAGNGVVLITTKKGKKGEGKVFYNGQYSIVSAANRLDVLNASEYINFLLESNYSEDELNDAYYNNPTSYKNNKLVDTDWQDEMYETGIRERHTIGVQGGNDRASYYLALNYMDYDGMVVGSEDTYERITTQMNVSYKVKDWLEVGSTSSIEKSDLKKISESSVTHGTASSVTLVADPLTPTEYSEGLIGANDMVRQAVADGHYPFINPETGNYYGRSLIIPNLFNPLAELHQVDKSTTLLSMNGTIYANITPVKNLVYTSRLGYRIVGSTTKSYTAPYWVASDNYSDGPSLSKYQNTSFYYQWENFANYNLTINKNELSAMAGMSFIQNTSETTGVSTNALLSLESNFLYPDYSTSAATDNISGTTSESTQIAYFGRLSWSYDNRYNLQANFRADAFDTSKLDIDHAWGYFPSVSAGWTISNEQFMQTVNTEKLSFLRLRLAYGINGSISNLYGYQYAASLQTGQNYYMENQLMNGTYPSSSLANPKLRWEESKQFDMGLDMRFFSDQLSLTADFFDKNTDGLLIQSTPSLITGTTSVFQNVGIVHNSGFEFDLNWKSKIGNDFSYSISANISTIKNEVKEYLGEGVRISGSDVGNTDIPVSYFEEGYPVWYLRGFKVQDIDDEDGSVIYVNTPGTDESIGVDDQGYIGDAIPDFTYGATISLNYKNFDFLIYGVGSYGADILYGVTNVSFRYLNRPHFLYDDRWTSTNTSGTRPSAIYQSDPYYLSSDAMVFDGSYFKIKQIQFGYNVPTSWLRKVKISSLRAYISLEDFFTFTKYPGLDPEVRTNDTSSMAIDEGGYPITKSVLFGINLSL